MYEQFKQEIRDFFIQYSISSEVGTKIWVEWLLKKSGLELKTNKFSMNGTEKGIYLNIDHLSLGTLSQLLKFLEVDEASYKTNTSIALNKEFVEKLFNEFKEEWQQSFKESPKKILPFQIESQQKLESGAISNIWNCANALLDDLKPTENESDMQLSLKLLALTHEKIRYYYDKNSHFITRLHSDIQDFVNANPGYKANEKLTKLLQYFADYNRFNRLEIKQLVSKFFKDLETFLNTFQVSGTECDLFENTIYQMANIFTLPQQNKFETSYRDSTRVNFTITGMSDKNIEKLISYFKALGDETIIRNPKNEDHGVYLESTSAVQSMSMEKAMIISDFQHQVKVKKDTIQVDGEFLAKTIFPLFQSRIISLSYANPEYLKPYQEKSKGFMEALDKANKKLNEANVSSLGIFGSQTAANLSTEVASTHTVNP